MLIKYIFLLGFSAAICFGILNDGFVKEAKDNEDAQKRIFKWKENDFYTFVIASLFGAPILDGIWDIIKRW